MANFRDFSDIRIIPATAKDNMTVKTKICICCGREYPIEKVLHCSTCGCCFCESCAARLKDTECANELTYFD